MSDVLSDVHMYLSEPDETVLTAALRNKDDIPILMDIVGDDASSPESQEEYFEKSMSYEYEEPDAGLETPTSYEYEEPEIASSQSSATESIASSAGVEDGIDERLQDHSAALSSAIEKVLQRKLPEIIEEVMLEISRTNKQ